MSYREPKFLNVEQAMEKFGRLQGVVNGVKTYLEFEEDGYVWQPRYNDNLNLRGYERVDITVDAMVLDEREVLNLLRTSPEASVIMDAFVQSFERNGNRAVVQRYHESQDKRRVVGKIEVSPVAFARIMRELFKHRGNPLSNTEVLCFVLGWQGGTVHQVARCLPGVSVSDILDADAEQMRYLMRLAQQVPSIIKNNV